eukprot:IDg12133t1
MCPCWASAAANGGGNGRKTGTSSPSSFSRSSSYSLLPYSILRESSGGELSSNSKSAAGVIVDASIKNAAKGSAAAAEVAKKVDAGGIPARSSSAIKKKEKTKPHARSELAAFLLRIDLQCVIAN